MNQEIKRSLQARVAALRFRRDHAAEELRRAVTNLDAVIECADVCRSDTLSERQTRTLDKIGGYATQYRDLLKNTAAIYAKYDNYAKKFEEDTRQLVRRLTEIRERRGRPDPSYSVAVDALLAVSDARRRAARYLRAGPAGDNGSAHDAFGRARGQIVALVGPLSSQADLFNAGAALRSLDAAVGHLDDIETLLDRARTIERNELDQIGPEISALAADLAHEIVREKQRMGDEARALLVSSSGVAVALAIAAVAIVFAFSLMFANRIAASIIRVADGMRRLAQGDLTANVALDAPVRELHEIVGAMAVFKRNATLAMSVEMSQRQQTALEAYATALTHAKEEAEQATLTDPLTGLRNRLYLDLELRRRASEAAEGEEVHALHLDLDRFKQVNDAHGHDIGDRLLQRVAERLRQMTHADDLITRIGGDEFVILCAAGSPRNAAEAIAERLVGDLAAPETIDGRVCRIGASVGVASASLCDAGELIAHTDVALHHAKRSGRGRVARFAADLRAEMLESRRLSDEILDGLERGEFVPFFQPQFDAESLELVGVEALARWRHPSRGILAPHAFLSNAEEIGAVARIDRRILEAAVDFCRRSSVFGVPIPKCSVNVSFSRLTDPELTSDLPDFSNLDTKISFELLETIYFDSENDVLLEQLSRLRALGVEIEIDDFGSGHASIVGLVRVAPHRLKIDRALVRPIDECSAHRRLVGSIVEMGRSHGIEVIAEGVETMRHADILRELGCDALQGYAFARPMGGEDLLTFIAHEAWRHAPGGGPKAA